MFIGYLVKMLWVPAAVGVLIFLIEIVVVATSGSADNPYMPLFAIFIAMWTVMFSAGWRRMELTFQREWDTVDYDRPDLDRTQFVQNPKTYKRLNTISHKEEYFPDPLWRFLAVVFSFLVVSALMMANIAAVVFLEGAKSGVRTMVGDNPLFGALKVLGAALQALLIILSRRVAMFVFEKLNDFENWKTDWEYHTATVAKTMCFGFVNSYFAIFFVSFMANSVELWGLDLSCPEHKCLDYVETMIAVIFILQAAYR